jgi:hypothetical protein
VVEGVADDAPDVDPVVILREEDALIVGEFGVFEKVEFFELSGVKRELSDKSGVTEDEERVAPEVGKVGFLVGVLLYHVLHKALGVSVLPDVLFLHT